LALDRIEGNRKIPGDRPAMGLAVMEQGQLPQGDQQRSQTRRYNLFLEHCSLLTAPSTTDHFLLAIPPIHWCSNHLILPHFTLLTSHSALLPIPPGRLAQDRGWMIADPEKVARHRRGRTRMERG
jgi:hypothetical protein